MEPWESKYINSVRDQEYADNALGIMVITLKFRLDGFDDIARESVTDGSNDKGADIVFVDRDLHTAVIAQCYYSDKDKPSAKANKAALLNQTSAWLFDDELRESLPSDLRRQIGELRDALDAGDIHNVYLWYVHNLPTSGNVEGELRVAANQLSTLLKTHYNDRKIEVIPEEIGADRIKYYYEQVSRPVLVSDEITFSLSSGYYEVASDGWKSLATEVRGYDLKKLFDKYEEDLFSANLRGYLGSKKSDSNINNGIKETVKNSPENFFIFNNGVTALVNEYDIDSEDLSVTVSGISIVNGAQTTGALSSAEGLDEDSEVMVGVRFIQANDLDTIDDVVRYNNSQNKIEAADFRSNDPIQRRLVEEFKSIPGVEYDGGRRGGAEDVMRRKKALPSGSVAQSLASFHGLAQEAVRGYTHLWNDERIYRKVFDDAVNAPHIVFCYTLTRCIQEYRADLAKRAALDSGSLKKNEMHALNFLSVKGSQYLLSQCVAEAFEEILDKQISNLYRLQFRETVNEMGAIDLWKVLIHPLLKSPERLADIVENQKKITNDSIDKARPLISERISLMADMGNLSEFRESVVMREQLYNG